MCSSPLQGFRDSGIGSQGVPKSLEFMCKTKVGGAVAGVVGGGARLGWAGLGWVGLGSVPPRTCAVRCALQTCLHACEVGQPARWLAGAPALPAHVHDN